MKKIKFLIFILMPLFFLPTLFLQSCSNTNKCETKREGSFASFLDDEWRTYCNTYEEHISEPLEYDLVDLAEFFGSHEEKLENMHEALIRFEHAESCFDTGRKKLEYRELKSCITYSDEQDTEMQAAFLVAIEPWFDEVKHTVKSVNPKLKKAEGESVRLLEKATHAIDRKSELRETPEAHLDNIQSLKTRVKKARASVEVYEDIKSALAANGELRKELDLEWSDEIEVLEERLQDQDARIAKIENLGKFIKLIKTSSGKSCPRRGLGNRKEAKIAKKTLGEYFKKIEAGRVRIDGGIETFMDEDSQMKTQAFSGFVCGLRILKKGDVFPAPVCAIHRFEVSRVKDRGFWTEWESTIEEGKLKAGVDCALD